MALLKASFGLVISSFSLAGSGNARERLKSVTHQLKLSRNVPRAACVGYGILKARRMSGWTAAFLTSSSGHFVAGGFDRHVTQTSVPMVTTEHRPGEKVQ